ncbi:LCP family protein [Patescibacteria group bacterium]
MRGIFNIKIVLIIVIILGIVVLAVKNGKGWFDPISIAANISAADLKEDGGRTNVLLLGSDKRKTGKIESELTDTLLIASIGRVDHDVVLISLPRDLWVESPTGYHSKINAIYAYGGNPEIMQVVENVLGVPIHYYGVVNFDLFKDVVDILGGVEVVIDNDFTDYFYPIEGKENSPRAERYETVHFEAGSQNMDGETALKFVRSRKGDNGEGTDFARSARQQKVIAAIKTKLLSFQTLVNPVKLKELYDLYSNEVDTNITFSDIQNFYLLSQQIDFSKVISIVLDDRSAADEGGLLYSPEDTELFGGAYVLIPKTGNFSQLHAYVQRYIFGEGK